jgi:hypothetical protein
MPTIWNCPNCDKETYKELQACPHCQTEFTSDAARATSDTSTKKDTDPIPDTLEEVARVQALKPSRWLIVLHFLGGSYLFITVQMGLKNSVTLGALPYLILFGIGYVGSKLLVSAIWKKVLGSKARFLVSIALLVAYNAVNYLLFLLIR